MKLQTLLWDVDDHAHQPIPLCPCGSTDLRPPEDNERKNGVDAVCNECGAYLTNDPDALHSL
jgi:hypothetical protein